jgi:hypothetical protein
MGAKLIRYRFSVSIITNGMFDVELSRDNEKKKKKRKERREEMPSSVK